MIVVGDLNLWIDVEGNNNVQKVVTLMNGYGLSQIIDKPTQRSGHTLDHVYVNPFQMELRYKVLGQVQVKTAYADIYKKITLMNIFRVTVSFEEIYLMR